MNPQTAIHACSSSSSCAVVRIYRAKQTNSKNKWINTHCASGGGGVKVRVCVSRTVLVRMRVYAQMLVCASLPANVPRAPSPSLRVFALPRLLLLLLEEMNGCCVCASVELKVDLCYSTTRWQNAAILQTEPTLGWPRYCNSSSHSARLAMAPECSRHGAV